MLALLFLLGRRFLVLLCLSLVELPLFLHCFVLSCVNLTEEVVLVNLIRAYNLFVTPLTKLSLSSQFEFRTAIVLCVYDFEGSPVIRPLDSRLKQQVSFSGFDCLFGSVPLLRIQPAVPVAVEEIAQLKVLLGHGAVMIKVVRVMGLFTSVTFSLHLSLCAALTDPLRWYVQIS